MMVLSLTLRLSLLMKNAGFSQHLDGVKQVSHVANVYVPDPLSTKIMTLGKYDKFQRRLPSTLGMRRRDITFMSTGVDMEKVAFCEKSYRRLPRLLYRNWRRKKQRSKNGRGLGNWMEKDTHLNLHLAL